MDKVFLTNKANGKEATMDKSEWDKLPELAKRPFNVKIVKTPQAVLDLEAEKAKESDAVETTETAQNSTQTEKTTEANQKQKHAQKKSKTTREINN